MPNLIVNNDFYNRWIEHVKYMGEYGMVDREIARINNEECPCELHKKEYNYYNEIYERK